jgi:asparagine synthase (glutamine-hydrolysing)
MQMNCLSPSDLAKELERAVRAALGDSQEAAVAYSGGLDSSIVGGFAKRFARVDCCTCALRGSQDDSRAREAAAADNMSLKMFYLEPGDLPDAVARASAMLSSSDPVKIAYTIPVLCVIDRSSEHLILTGSGADELFGGYARYVGSARVREEMKEDLSKAISEADVLDTYAQARGKRLACPFLDERLVGLCADLEPNLLMADGRRKVILRDVAALLGLSSFDRPKKAAQYSSGVMAEMRRQARRQKVSLGEWVREASSARNESN